MPTLLQLYRNLQCLGHKSLPQFLLKVFFHIIQYAKAKYLLYFSYFAEILPYLRSFGFFQIDEVNFCSHIFLVQIGKRNMLKKKSRGLIASNMDFDRKYLLFFFFFFQLYQMGRIYSYYWKFDAYLIRDFTFQRKRTDFSIENVGFKHPYRLLSVYQTFFT